MTNLCDELRTKCDWCDPCDSCVVLMEKAAQEIERLQAIEAEHSQAREKVFEIANRNWHLPSN